MKHDTQSIMATVALAVGAVLLVTSFAHSDASPPTAPIFSRAKPSVVAPSAASPVLATDVYCFVDEAEYPCGDALARNAAGADPLAIIVTLEAR